MSKAKEVLNLVNEGRDDFLDAYLEAALWSSTNYGIEGGDDSFFDDNYSINDFSKDAIKQAKNDINQFQKLAGDALDDIGDSQAGHDFWLTRNGHGAGFWDRGYEKEVEKKLMKAVKKFGEINLYAQNGEVGFE